MRLAAEPTRNRMPQRQPAALAPGTPTARRAGGGLVSPDPSGALSRARGPGGLESLPAGNRSR
jgi:hypothetical protein